MESITRIGEPARVQRLIAREDSLPDLDRPPQSVKIDLERAKKNRVVLPEDTGAAAHSYRMLRAQLLRRIRSENTRAIGIISAVDGEGKTLTAVNLALSLAADPNQSVLLMDLDLRRPNVARTLELSVVTGLDTWLAGRALDEPVAYCIEGFERLVVVPTLAPVPCSSETLSSPRAQQMLAAMKADPSHRLMILDLPPVLLTDDFLTIAPLLDGVVLVAREGRTKREDLQRVRELLGSTPLLGTVLNASTQSERRAY